MIATTYTGYTVVKTAGLPVPFEDARRQLRLDDSQVEDQYYKFVLLALCDDVERTYNHAMLTQTVTETHSSFPYMSSDPLRLAIFPGIAVTSVSYIDSAGATQTLSNTLYSVATNSAGMFIVMKVDQAWPTDLAIRPDAVTVVYTAGYGTNPSFVPAAMRLAILNKLGKMDANREDAVSEKVTASDILLQAFYRYK